MDCEKVTDINDDKKDVIFSSICSSGTPFKKFVPAKAESILKSKKNKCLSVSGTEIKNSYINIVGDDAFHSASNSRLNKSCKKLISNEKTRSKSATVDTDINVNILMNAVETNNVSKVTELLKINKDLVLNIKDQYGWTALMCACCAGAKDVVQLLLTYKPDLNIIDKAGNTCLSLAKSKGNKCIVSLLNDYLNTSVSKLYKAVECKENPSKKSESFYCETCKEIVLQSMESHLLSTVHLFNSSRKTGIPTAYGIPESNVGFQMLLKTGWDREKGLGPEGSGHKFPPKTVLKQDRAGLGAKKYSARVTHDPHLVAKERTERQKTLNRRERIRNELKNKRKEQELRRALD